MTDDSPDAPPAVSPTITLIVVATVHFVVSFLMSATNVALPTIGHDLKAGAVQLSLTITILVLANSSLLLPVGRFADIYGRRRIFIIGLMVLALSTLALGLTGSIRVFLFLRFVQGLGMSTIMATSIPILTAVFPPQRRGRAMGVVISMTYFGLSLGPSLSGFIVAHLGWRWIFYIVFGCMVAAVILIMFRLNGEQTSAAGEPFDYVGSAVFMVSLGLLVYGASRLAVSASARWVCAAGIIGLALFARIEWKAAHPLLDLRVLLDNLGFSFSNVATFLNYAAMSSFMFFFSLYLQYAKGLSPQQAGLLMMVQPMMQALLAPLAGRLSEKHPPSIIATIGMGICTVGLTAAALINPETSFTYIVVVMILLGMSLGLFSTPNMTAIMNSVGPKHQGTAASLVSTMRSMGMLFSSTAIAVILSIFLGQAPVTRDNIPAFIHSMHTSLYFFSILSFLGVIFSMAKGRLAASMTGSRHT